jgi:hypothetical protein
MAPVSGEPIMAQPTLEARVAALEREMAELKTALASGEQPKDWRLSLGMFTGDEVMKRIDDAALKFREADREKARRRYAKTRRTKK